MSMPGRTVGSGWPFSPLLLPVVFAACHVALTLAQGGGAPGSPSYASSILALAGQRLLWQVTAAPNCTSVYAFNRSDHGLIWRQAPVEAHQQWSGLLGGRHAYAVSTAEPRLAAVSLTSGKTKWDFPKPSISRVWRPSIDLPRHAWLAAPLETLPPLPPDSLALSPPAGWYAGSLVLVISRQPDNRLYAVGEEDGVLQWELVLEDGSTIVDVFLPDAGAKDTALVSVLAPPSKGAGSLAPLGYLACVDLVNGTTRWVTGQITGAPTVVLAAPATLVLRGPPAPDLTEDLYGVSTHTGAMMWSKACSLGCAVLPTGDGHTVVLVRAARGRGGGGGREEDDGRGGGMTPA